TFFTLAYHHTISGSSIAYAENISTTITGLTPGIEYNIPFFMNPNGYNSSLGSAIMCTGAIVIIDGVQQLVSIVNQNIWYSRNISFIANGPTASLTVLAAVSPSPTE